METILVYAICVTGVFATFFLLTLRQLFVQFIKYICLWLSKTLIYPQILRRHSSLGPWTPAGLIVHTAYVAINIYCLEFWKLTATKVSFRAAYLALINMMPLFLGAHHGFLADMLGVSLKTFRKVHRSAGMMSFALVLCHVLILVARGIRTFSLSVSENLYGLIVCSHLEHP